ncbi:MAG: efflux RND transporter periplasmic adaptor subunit [Acidobacteriota bacterium]
MLTLLAVLATFAAGCGSSSGPQGRGPGSAVAVRTTGVQRMSVQRQIDLAGTLLSPDQARVGAEAAGVVRRVLVEIGREVAIGTPLVEIEPRELRLALERAEAALLQTRAQLGMDGTIDGGEVPLPDDQIASVRTATANRDDARASYERAKALNARGITSSEVLQAADTKYKVAEASYQAALDSVRATKALLRDRRAAHALALKQLDDAIVRAPIAGVVSDRPVQVGEYIPERTVVATIVQMNPLKLRTGVQERHAGIVEPGQPVQFRVEAFGDRVFTGRVAYVSPALDQTMRTFTIEALVENPNRLLKPGFFAKGVILTRLDAGVPAVPDAAVSVLAGVASVYVITDDAVTQTTVELGVRQGDLWEITSGLTGDEVLATSRLNELATGVRVRVLKPGESEASPGAGASGESRGQRGTGAGATKGGGGRAGGGKQGRVKQGGTP